jgi:hypothetical protein
MKTVELVVFTKEYIAIGGKKDCGEMYVLVGVQEEHVTMV